MRKGTLIVLLALICLSTLAVARRQLSPAAPLSAVLSKSKLLPALTNNAAGVVIPNKRSSAVKKGRLDATAAKSQHADKEAIVYQSDYAAARTHPPTEPP
ncbi:hypothetical protein GOP47_0017807 [Adiantum capillus-veneris]|uniref:Secreted protein n=1 Tax=Adiantum capillus-veneris TaxID=13818 RepID=A0A9D4UG41_ADICA|nr:hypothetical protein GOP47_0017807 [Adiantum capillus-veneris]